MIAINGKIKRIYLLVITMLVVMLYYFPSKPIKPIYKSNIKQSDIESKSQERYSGHSDAARNLI